MSIRLRLRVRLSVRSAGEYQPVVSFLDDEAYARCLDTLVKACNDMLLTHQGKVFLGKRQVFPQKVSGTRATIAAVGQGSL
jgi:hypothetical protein